MRVLELSPREARRLAVGAQGLAGPPPKRPTRAMALDVIRRLGAVQIDSISVVARSHHIVLWSRLGPHPPEWLYEFLAKDRAIFEYWAHAAAYVPIELFPYFRRRMLRYQDLDGAAWNSSWWKGWIAEHRQLLDDVVAYIRQNGPVCTSSFEPPEGAPKAAAWAWYGNKPTNRALDMLWTMGVLMIDRREKFQRWYDLRERVHPTWDDADLPSIEDERRVLSEMALRAMGITTVRWFADYFRTDWGARNHAGSTSRRLLHQLVDAGIAVPVRVRGLDDEAFVAADLLDRRIPPSRTTLLSPFDNLIWDRRRTRGLFDFELRLEAYTPADQRRFGYFSLPILYRDQIVGRVDPKADRRRSELRLNLIHLEPWFEPQADERFYASLAGAVESFRVFNACESVVVGRGEPEISAARLRAALRVAHGAGADA